MTFMSKSIFWSRKIEDTQLRQKDHKFDSSSEAGSLKRHIYSVYNAMVRKISDHKYIFFINEVKESAIMQFIDKSQYTLHYRLIFLCYLTMTTNIPIEKKTRM